MSKLNLFLLFEEKLDDSKSFLSCLMYKNYFFITIASYLSNDIKEFLTKQGTKLPSVSHQSLLFNYLSLCRKTSGIDVFGYEIK
uniref:Uncharacterized protein n=1 Tax=Rhizophagus irregularis (strain DAOM 181602 / DAOM 197198 / MUCL 43194) TaxID=747089 RepID=U9UVW2_RHIID